MGAEGEIHHSAGDRAAEHASRRTAEAPGLAGDAKASKQEEEEEKKKPTIPYYKLFYFADSKDVLLMLVGTIGAVVNGLALPLMTLLFGNVLDSFGQSDMSQVVRKVSKVCLQFVYLAVGAGIASFLQVTFWMVTGERQAARIRSMYLRAILRQEVAFFDRETSTGEVIGRMSGDTVLIQDAMGEKVSKFIQLMSTFVGGFIIAFVKGWLLTLVMLASLPPLMLASVFLAAVMTRTASKGQLAYAEASTIVERTIGAIRTVVSFTGEKRAIEEYKKSLTSACNAGIVEGVAMGAGFGLLMAVMFCTYALGVWYGAKLILNSDYTGGRVIIVIFAVLTSSFSLGQTSPSITAFLAGQAAGFKMFETINRKPEIDAYSSGKKLDDIRGDIELKDIFFTYPTRPDEQIFRGFSLSIKSGLSVALVGESGSGKSTVISLIERFYDPQSGEVLIDGINMKEFQLRWIRSKIGLVSQEPVLFASSISDNISYGKDGATDEEIRAAAELANALKFIDKMPQGFNTMVGEHGTQLSGGQKQRVAIARAILKDPRILLLDEATSALDSESERIVQEALDRVMTSRTTVIVAHRLTTIRNADTIAVIHRGTIVEKGPHLELIKDPDSAYSQLIRLQESQHDSYASPDPQSTAPSMELTRQSSLRGSLQRATSRGSSAGNSNRHSFSVQLGIPTGTDLAVSAVDDVDATNSREKEPKVSVLRLAYFNKPEIPALLLGTFAAIVCGMIMPMFGLVLSSIIKTFYSPPHKLRKDSKFWSSMFVVVAAVTLVSFPARTYFFALAGSKLIKRIRLKCFEKVVHMEVGWFDHPDNSSGAIGARLSSDAAQLRGLVGDSLGLIVQNVASLVAGLVIALLANWQLSLIIIALVPFIGLNGYIQMKFLKGFSDDAKAKYEEASQVASDAVGSIRTVASFSAEDKVLDLYKKKCELPMKAGVRQGVVSGIGFGISFFLLFCVYATVFYAGAKFVEDGKTTFDDVFKVFFVLVMAAMGISQSSTLAPDSTKAQSSAASIFTILDGKSKIDASVDSGNIPKEIKGNIEFKHVKFHYPTRPDVQIFQDLCFRAHSGKTLALVGESGCGKSTVIALLERFYDPISGQIFLDGVDIQTLKLSWLRQQMGLVSQEPVLFNDIIKRNIAYGKDGEETSEAEITSAAELANAHGFISTLQQGYETLVGERGIQLSGGQKQRVAIARAIVKDPRILLLDEATSALDAESERVVQDALDRVMVSRTTIVIAHRLSTIRGADMIAVVKNGVIVEKGKHDTLISIKDGAYASLVALHASASH